MHDPCLYYLGNNKGFRADLFRDGDTSASPAFQKTSPLLEAELTSLRNATRAPVRITMSTMRRSGSPSKIRAV